MDISKIPINIIVSIIISLFGAFISYRILWSKEKLANKAKFREPFLKTLEKINSLVPDKYDSITDILKTDYPIHDTAFINYCYTLTFIGKWFLRKKWLAYRGKYPKPPELPQEDFRYRFCHFISTNHEDLFEKKEQVIKSIKKLIS